MFKKSYKKGKNMSNPYKKPFTSIFIIYEKMRHSYETGDELDISNLRNALDELIPRSSISMYINKITREQFPGVTFYTRTKDGALLMGCYNPKSKGKINDMPTAKEILRVLDN